MRRLKEEVYLGQEAHSRLFGRRGLGSYVVLGHSRILGARLAAAQGAWTLSTF